MRSPVWAWHDPRELEEGGDFEYMDQGRQSFLVRLVPHAGDWRAAGVPRLAAELNQPPFVLIETFHVGPLPQRRSFVSDGGGALTTQALPVALLANPADAFRLFNLAAAEASAAAGGMGGAAAAIPLWQSALSIALWPLLALMLAIAAFRKVSP